MPVCPTVIKSEVHTETWTHMFKVAFLTEVETRSLAAGGQGGDGSGRELGVVIKVQHEGGGSFLNISLSTSRHWF